MSKLQRAASCRPDPSRPIGSAFSNNAQFPPDRMHGSTAGGMPVATVNTHDPTHYFVVCPRSVAICLVPRLHHSYRSAFIGSTLVARRAGSQQASQGPPATTPTLRSRSATLPPSAGAPATRPSVGPECAGRTTAPPHRAILPVPAARRQSPPAPDRYAPPRSGISRAIA